MVEVVNDDMPFLVDSVSMALNRLGLLIHLTIHPVIAVKRAADGTLAEVLESPEGDGGQARFESFMHFEIDRQSDPERLDAIRADLETALGDVRAAVEDWRTMMGKVEQALADLKPAARSIDPEELAEVEAFLRWIADDHFTFLGYGCYELIRDRDGDQLKRIEGSALGLLRRQRSGTSTSRSFAALPPEVRKQARMPVPLMITKANARSTVHRPVYLDYIGVRRFDADGKVLGEHRFLGLFTSAAYNRNPRDIPLLGRKVAGVIERAGLAPAGHSGKALVNILETYPRDELLQTPRGRAVRDRAGDPAPPGAPADPPVPAPGRVRALRLLPGLRAARPLQHRDPAQVPGHPAGGVERHRGRVPGADLGVDPGPDPVHRAHPGGHRAEDRARRDRGPSGRGRALLERRAARGPDRRPRRGRG